MSNETKYYRADDVCRRHPTVGADSGLCPITHAKMPETVELVKMYGEQWDKLVTQNMELEAKCERLEKALAQLRPQATGQPVRRTQPFITDK